MFWSEQQTRNVQALADRADEQRSQRALFTVTTGEAIKDVPPIDWLAEYERKADARKAAWEASPFYDAWCRLFAFRGSSGIVHP